MNDESFFASRDANVQHEPGGDPDPADESLPDGQFQDDDMPTTDGEALDGTGPDADPEPDAQPDGGLGAR